MTTYTQRKEPKRPQDIAAEQKQQEIMSNADSDWPECEECGENYPPKRKDLGYHTCLSCGSPKIEFAIVPVPKSNYTVARSLDDVKSPYSHKGNR